MRHAFRYKMKNAINELSNIYRNDSTKYKAMAVKIDQIRRLFDNNDNRFILIDITDPSYRDVIYNEIKKSSYINPYFINNVWF